MSVLSLESMHVPRSCCFHFSPACKACLQKPHMRVLLTRIAKQTNRFAMRKAAGKRPPADNAEFGSDYASKLLHLAWHPEANVIAAAASNSLYMYCK